MYNPYALVSGAIAGGCCVKTFEVVKESHCFRYLFEDSQFLAYGESLVTRVINPLMQVSHFAMLRHYGYFLEGV